VVGTVVMFQASFIWFWSEFNCPRVVGIRVQSYAQTPF